MQCSQQGSALLEQPLRVCIQAPCKRGYHGCRLRRLRVRLQVTLCTMKQSLPLKRSLLVQGRLLLRLHRCQRLLHLAQPRHRGDSASDRQISDRRRAPHAHPPLCRHYVAPIMSTFTKRLA